MKYSGLLRVKIRPFSGIYLLLELCTVAVLCCWCYVKADDTRDLQSTSADVEQIVGSSDTTNSQRLTNPTNGIEDLKKIYQYINFYRGNHDGHYPASTSVVLIELTKLPQVKSIKDYREARAAFINPDTRYADSYSMRSDPNNFSPYVILNIRPDGNSIGGPKLPNTRDILAYTDLYVHNITITKDEKELTVSSGFYLVLWDDGDVDKIPYDLAYYTSSGANLTLSFPGQAGVPADTVTFNELQSK